MSKQFSRPLSCIELDRAALLSNIAVFRDALPKGTKLAAVVKANAYGHGMKEIVSVVASKVDYFQVDDFLELRELRKDTKKPVFVFGCVASSELVEAVRLGAIFGVCSVSRIRELEKIAVQQKKNVLIHLKIDAFLGRQGIFIDTLPEIIKVLEKCPHVKLEAVYSHFSNIEDTDDLAHAHKQHAYLLEAKKVLAEAGFKNISHHISATSGFLSDPRTNWGGAVLRLGIGMYGLWPSESLKKRLNKKFVLKPVLSWKCHLAEVKEIPKGFPVGYGCTFVAPKKMRIGIVPQGYSDGYDRGLSNSGEVLVQGKRCRVLGRVAMNMFAVDLSRVAGAKVEDEVVLLGRQGKEQITAEEIAKKINTINYEIVARLSPLLPKIVLR